MWGTKEDCKKFKVEINWKTRGGKTPSHFVTIPCLMIFRRKICWLKGSKSATS